MNCPACNYDPTLCVEHTWTLILKRGAQSINDVGVNSKNNRAYRGSRRKWKKLLQPYSRIPKATKLRRIYFCRFYGKGKRPYDYGNLVGGFKPLLDEIVRAGLLVDDRPNTCADYYRQEKSPCGTDYVTVIIEDVNHATNT
jgi:hypothetical protein